MVKEKVSKDFLFISFANSQLERQDILNLVNGVSVLNNLQIQKTLFAMCDINKIETHKSKNKKGLSEFEKFHELFLKKTYFPLRQKEKESMAKNYTRSMGAKKLEVVSETPYALISTAKRLLNISEIDNKLYRDGYEELGIMFQFTYALKFSQKKLRGILKKAIGSSSANVGVVNSIKQYLIDVRTEIVVLPGDKQFLKMETRIAPVDNENVDRNPYLFFKKVIEPTVYIDLINFLSSDEKIKLKQCEQCNKFFKATRNNPKQMFCRFNGNECHDTYHNKDGKGAARLRKGRQEGKYQY